MVLVKRILIGITAGTLFLFVVGYMFFDLMADGLCGNEVFHETISPNQERRAIIFQRDCGATTGFSTQVSIVDSGRELENKSGNVLTMNGRPRENNLILNWKGSNELKVISGKTEELNYKAISVGDVTISYD
jgi:hypothetical protein